MWRFRSTRYRNSLKSTSCQIPFPAPSMSHNSRIWYSRYPTSLPQIHTETKQTNKKKQQNKTIRWTREANSYHPTTGVFADCRASLWRRTLRFLQKAAQIRHQVWGFCMSLCRNHPSILRNGVLWRQAGWEQCPNLTSLLFQQHPKDRTKWLYLSHTHSKSLCLKYVSKYRIILPSLTIPMSAH